MTQQTTTNFDPNLITQEPEELKDNISYNETKRLLSNNAFSVNEVKSDVIPEVPPRNVASRQRAQSLYIDSSRYHLSYNVISGTGSQVNYNSSSIINPSLQHTPSLTTQSTINSNVHQSIPQRQVGMPVSNQTGIPQPPVHNYGIPNSNTMMIYQSSDLQKQMNIPQPSPRQLSQIYQMNRQLQQQNSTNDNVSTYSQSNSIAYNRATSLPISNQYDIQYNQTIRNPNSLPFNKQDSNSVVQPQYTNAKPRRQSISNPMQLSYSSSSSISATQNTSNNAVMHPLPSPQSSNYQKVSSGYSQSGNSFSSPISPAQNQIPQGRPLPSNPQTPQQTVISSSSSINRVPTHQISTNNLYNPSVVNASSGNTTAPPLSAPVRVTSMMVKPGQQFIYRNQNLPNGSSQMQVYKSHSSTQLTSQPYYQSPMVQPTSASPYITSTQYIGNGKISPSMQPQYSPQLLANRNGSPEDSLSSSLEGPSIPPRKVKPRYNTSSTYYNSPSLNGVSYSPRLHNIKNESDYENYRNNRPLSIVSTSSENIVELPKRISSNKSSTASSFGYRNNSRSSICSAPDLYNSFYNSNIDVNANIPEGTELNSYSVNGNNPQNKYFKYSRSVHGYSAADDSSSEYSESVGNLKSQYGSTNSLNNLVKYDHMKIVNMFMDDEVYQIGDLRDKYPLIDHSPLLSEIASDFSETISLVRHIKDNIEYLDCFSGYEAVSLLAEILGTEDRKVALQIGQVLEEYGMFHDVVYMHKLMDNKDHFYQMHTLALPIARAVTLSRTNYRHDMIVNNITTSEMDLQIKNMSEISISSTSEAMTAEEKKKKEEENKNMFPTGVLVGIAQCYSPTCFEDSPCYSYSCPKRRMYEKVTNKNVSLEHIKTSINANLSFQTTWSTSIGKPYVKKMEKKEIKRQEIIYEFIQTEKEYVDDLLAVKTKIMEPLREGKVSKIGEYFVQGVFSNIEELYEVNKNFYNNIHELQKRKPILESIGDIVKDFIPHLRCYERYGRLQPRAKHILQIERSHNKNLNNFFKNAQYEAEFRRLPIESFLARPTTRLGRYPILIKDIIKNTPEGHRDNILLNDALQGIESVLKEVNNQAGRATNKLKLEEWSVLLESERKDDISLLRLENPEREFIREGKLELKRYANEAQNHSFIPITLVLLDNMLVITKPKVNSIEIYKKPIPLQLLSLVIHENNEQGNEAQGKHKRGNKNDNHKCYNFTIVHQGVATYLFQTMVYSEQQAWINCIKEQVSKYRTESIVKVVPLITNPGTRIIAANYISNMLFLLATENGIYIQSDNKMKLVLPLAKISHMEVMPQYKLLFIIANKEVFPFSIDLLINGLYITKPNLRKVKKLSSNVNFIAVGRCDDRDLLCCVKTTSLNSTIKIFEPKGDGLMAMQQNKSLNDVIYLYKQFYIPSEARSITFLKKSLCIGCVKGFEVVDINTLTTQSLLSNIPKFDFVLKSDNVPIRVFRTPRQDFLLLYSKIGFFLDKNGNRSRPDIMFRWFGSPTTFAYYPPYIFSFEHNSINVWEENSPEVVKQVIPSNSLKLLYENNNQVLITEIKNQLQILSILQITPYQY